MAAAAKLKQVACEAIDTLMPQLKALSQDIWNHPELCFEERYAHEKVTNFLEQNGFSVERSYKLETAFRAIPKDVAESKSGPNIAILCEYDALPEIGHACGHNLISMVGVGSSFGVLAALRSSDYQGSGKVLCSGVRGRE
jgi:metal-dependent amidase/aminoacylase/carboxypeptidase family protein